jgi:hypothetical protein
MDDGGRRRRFGRVGAQGVAVLAGAVLLAGCPIKTVDPVPGTDAPPVDVQGSAPAPSDMCPAGQYPVVAAYGLADGAFRWVTCDTGPDMYVSTAASDDHVWVERLDVEREMLRIDVRSGEIVGRGAAANYPGDVPDGADVRRTSPPSTASVFVRGGQDDPLQGIDKQTGEAVWAAVGVPAYDDVWAGDDEAVYVVSWDMTGQTPGSWMVAYAIETGEALWKADLDDLGLPWHAANGRLFTMWSDLNVLDTADGSLLWSTSYDRSSDFPRLFGAVTNADAVFVSFTMVPSGGD